MDEATKKMNTTENDKDYMDLIRRFPLLFIKNECQWRDASTLVEELSKRLSNLSASERGYFDVLCDLIRHYESADTLQDNIVPQQALRYLMEINDLTTDDLLSTVNDKSLLSGFLKGRKELTQAAAIRLGERFKVSAALFLPHQQH
jgi:antitoxin component HigA of HigAB toxin-antitoxin module